MVLVPTVVVHVLVMWVLMVQVPVHVPVPVNVPVVPVTGGWVHPIPLVLLIPPPAFEVPWDLLLLLGVVTLGWRMMKPLMWSHCWRMVRAAGEDCGLSPSSEIADAVSTGGVLAVGVCPHGMPTLAMGCQAASYPLS